VARVSPAAALVASLLAAGSCCLGQAEPTQPTGNPTLGLPSVPIGDRTPDAQIELGRRLFHDARLSRDGSVSCSTCHDAARAFTDGKPVSLGVGGAAGTRNAPSLINVAYATTLFWDGRRSTLEAQVADPFTNPREHGLSSHEDLLARVATGDEYRPLLATAFPDESGASQIQHLFGALAAYLRTLRAGDSAFDRYYFAGEKKALDEPARRGFELFRGPAGCSQCHKIGPDSALFTDHKFHSVGVGSPDIAPQLPELTRKVRSLTPAQIDALVVADRSIAALGRFLVTKDPRDIGKYKTPSLRNVAMTAPYMHDGSVDTLREAVDHEIYYRSIELGRAFILTPTEREDLVAFLGALTSFCLKRGNCPGM
jgi:cytochrome c peroxidase